MTDTSPSPGFEMFLGRMKQYTLLTFEDEQRLFAALNSDVDEGERARIRDAIVCANLRFVVTIARKFKHASSLPVEDLVGEGFLGLLKAVEKFDYTKGFKFSTYAAVWIQRYVTDALAASGRAVRLNRKQDADSHRVFTTRQELRSRFGREPSIEELAAAARVSVETARACTNLSRGVRSLDQPIDSDHSESFTLADILADARHDDGPNVDDIHAVRSAVAQLSAQQQAFLEYQSRGWPIDLIADTFGVSDKRVYQIRDEAYERLRFLLSAYMEVA